MKKLSLNSLLLSLTFFASYFSTMLNAQCIPQSNYNDSTYGYYPRDTVLPCGRPNVYYEQIMHFKSTDSITVFGSRYAVDSGKIVNGSPYSLPFGLDYDVYPENILASEVACIRIYGTPPFQDSTEIFNLNYKVYSGSSPFPNGVEIDLFELDLKIVNYCSGITDIDNIKERAPKVTDIIIKKGSLYEIKKPFSIYTITGNVIYKSLLHNNEYYFNNKGLFFVLQDNTISKVIVF